MPNVDEANKRTVFFFRRDLGIVDPRHKEPFVKLLPQGMVTGQSFRIKATGQYISPKDAELDDDQKMVRETSLVVLSFGCFSLLTSGISLTLRS